jgi:hypothetical protein
MGLFGKSKEDTSQDAQIQQLQKDIATCWSWIQAHEKTLKILVPNNNSFIKKNKQFATDIQNLQSKDKEHDAKDKEIEAVLTGLKELGKAVETATSEE